MLRTASVWSNIVIQGWIQVGDYVSGPRPFRLDNLNLQYLPSSTFTGTVQCPAAPPTPTPTPTPSPTMTPTTIVDPISECNSAASNSQMLISILAMYRVNAIGSWTANELLELCFGMARTGQALQIQFGGRSPKDTFHRILIAPGRTVIDFVRELSGNPFCLTNNNVSPQQSVITCYGSTLQFTQYTAVHELGHVLVGRTGGYNPSNPSSFFNLIFNPYNNGVPVGAVYDYDSPVPGVVFGMFIDEFNTPDWVRGARGWGSPASSPPAGPCAFQQNTFTIRDGTVTPPPPPAQNPLDRERDEAAADMFLNWVYRTLGAGGFENRNQRNISDCTIIAPTDISNPGDARYNYFSTVVMPTLATYFPTPTANP